MKANKINRNSSSALGFAKSTYYTLNCEAGAPAKQYAVTDESFGALVICLYNIYYDSAPISTQMVLPFQKKHLCFL